MENNNWENEERVLAILAVNMRDREIYHTYTYGKNEFGNHFTKRSIALKYGISADRIRQIIDKCQRKLATPLAKEILSKKDAYNWSIGEYGWARYHEGYNNYAADHSLFENVDIAELDISVRSFNCLRRAGYDYVGEIPLDIEELKKIKNLGNKCAKEIVEKTTEFLRKGEK